MTDEEKRALSLVRFKRAEECLNTAEENVKLGDYRAAANRTYYAIFHGLRSVLALDEIDMSKHSAVIAMFRKAYLKTNILDRRFSGLITDAFEIRNESDYDDFFIVKSGCGTGNRGNKRVLRGNQTVSDQSWSSFQLVLYGFLGKGCGGNHSLASKEWFPPQK